MKKFIPIILSVAMLGIGSCKKVGEAAEKASTQGTLTANVNGKAYKARRVTATVTSSSFMFKGSDYENDEQMTIVIDKYTGGSGKYNFDLIYNTGTYYDTDTRRASTGEINIDKTGDKSAKGNFHFENSDSSYKITDGNFDIKWD